MQTPRPSTAPSSALCVVNTYCFFDDTCCHAFVCCFAYYVTYRQTWSFRFLQSFDRRRSNCLSSLVLVHIPSSSIHLPATRKWNLCVCNAWTDWFCFLGSSHVLYRNGFYNKGGIYDWDSGCSTSIWHACIQFPSYNVGR